MAWRNQGSYASRLLSARGFRELSVHIHGAERFFFLFFFWNIDEKECILMKKRQDSIRTSPVGRFQPGVSSFQAAVFLFFSPPFVAPEQDGEEEEEEKKKTYAQQGSASASKAVNP